MHDVYGCLVIPARTGDLAQDVCRFLQANGFGDTAVHSLQVAAQARSLAERFACDLDAAYAAGLLHDISAVFPPAERITVAEALGIEVLPEERRYPPIVHQKMSRVMSVDLFELHDPAVLSAVGCHTTLKPDPAPLDLVLFVADKIAWDQPGTPPWLDEICEGLQQSLEHAALVYLRYLWNQRDLLRVLHPWAEEAFRQLSEICREFGREKQV